MCVCVAQVLSEQMFLGFQDNDKALSLDLL